MFHLGNSQRARRRRWGLARPISRWLVSTGGTVQRVSAPEGIQRELCPMSRDTDEGHNGGYEGGEDNLTFQQIGYLFRGHLTHISFTQNRKIE